MILAAVFSFSVDVCDITKWNLSTIIDIFKHLDVFLNQWISCYQNWTYLVLFLIVFCETGLVVTPFLPGDSLLFASGLIAANGNAIELPYIIAIFFFAAFIGDNCNYFFGRFLGHKVYEKDYRFIKRKYIDQTHQFYEKHGGKALIIARFMPIIRTFAPFVAGVGDMKYVRFVSFSLIGNLIWVNLFCLLGYLLGNNEWVKTNFTMIILAIIIISVTPPILAIIKAKLKPNKQT